MDSFELDKAHEPIFLAYIIKMRYITVSHFIVKKYICKCGSLPKFINASVLFYNNAIYLSIYISLLYLSLKIF